MRVLCIYPPSPIDGLRLDVSPWVSVDRDYPVLAVGADFGGRVQLLLLADDGTSLGWFDSKCFLTVDTRLPPSWSARIGEGGGLELAPPAWLADGFWERYYDGEPNAVASVKQELAAILGDNPT